MNIAVGELTLVTGMSGAGRTGAADALEDLGFFVVDNLPPALIARVVDLASAGGEEPRLAFVVDVRGGGYFDQLSDSLRELSERGIGYRIVFLEARDDVLIRRYEGSKRKHPLADRIIDGIAKERALLDELRGAADLIIDTSDLSVHDLRDRMIAAFSANTREERLKINVLSFGFKHGLPADADMVLDVRYLPNPHWVDDLRPMSGLEEPVQRYVLDAPATKDLLERIDHLLEGMIPGWLDEGKRYMTIAIGCTGGRHRSVICAEQIGARIRERGLPVVVRHRDIERGSSG